MLLQVPAQAVTLQRALAKFRPMAPLAQPAELSDSNRNAG